jgi:hypothetical protein
VTDCDFLPVLSRIVAISASNAGNTIPYLQKVIGKHKRKPTKAACSIEGLCPGEEITQSKEMPRRSIQARNRIAPYCPDLLREIYSIKSGMHSLVAFRNGDF